MNFNTVLSQKLKAYLNENQMSQLDFLFLLKEKGCTISPSTLNYWVSGRSIPTKKNHQDVLFKILKINFDDIVTDFHSIEKRKFALLGQVACGEPIYADEQHEAYVFADMDIKADFCLIAKGDSMEPLVHNGDVVFVKKQSYVDNGQIAVVIINDEATLKRVYQEGDKITLVAENKRYAPIVVSAKDNKDVSICGLAVFYQALLV